MPLATTTISVADAILHVVLLGSVPQIARSVVLGIPVMVANKAAGARGLLKRRRHSVMNQNHLPSPTICEVDAEIPSFAHIELEGASTDAA